MTDYRPQRKRIHYRSSNDWVRYGNIVQVCIIRIRLTVDIAPICHQDESVRDMASVWMSYRMKSGVMSVALIAAWRFEERQRLPDRRQMLPRRYEVIGLSRVSLSFVSRTLGTAVTGRRTTPLPTTCCHKLPPHCKAIVQCRHWFYFAGETDY